MGLIVWRLLVTTDVGKEQWTRWEILDTIFPYDVNVYVRTFNKRGVLLVWSRLSSSQLMELLMNRLTRAYKLIHFDDCCPARLRDIIFSARRLIGDFKDISIESEVRGDYLGINEKELTGVLMEELNCLGGERKLMVEVVWDVVGLSLLSSDKGPLKARQTG